MTRRRPILLLAFLLLVPLAGCFTGIESTPKITDSELRRQQVSPTPEMRYLQDVLPEPFGSWRTGKEFYVTDDKIGLIFAPSQSSVTPAAGDTLTFLSHCPAQTITGQEATDITFALAKGGSETRYVYRVEAPTQALAQRPGGAVEIPFAIELSTVQKAADLLKGRRFFTMTPLWYDAVSDHAISGGLRYVPVTVTSVTPGNHVYPLKVTFVTETIPQAHGAVFMTLGQGYGATRDFGSLFSLKDPRLRYPAVQDDVWQNIVHGRVAVGMTRDECRLSLGAPREVDRRPSSAGLVEFWTYDDGTYLIFQDGQLSVHRGTMR